MVYNARIKTYADGTRQILYSEVGKNCDYTIPDDRKKNRLVPEVEVGDSHYIEKSLKRTKQVVYDIARNNDWDWFITLTFNPQKVNSFDYIETAEAVKHYTRHLHYNGNQWLLVPELHESGRIHFHGLIKGNLAVVDSGINGIYNITDYELGFTTASKIQSHCRVASYIAKYLTKELSVPKGKKRYWASRGLARPIVENTQMFHDEINVLLEKATYHKEITSAYGNYVLFEV